MTSKIIPCQNVWSLLTIPPYWTPLIKNENSDIICCKILHSSFSQHLFKVWLTIRGSSDKLCAPTFLTGNTKSFIRMDLLCPVAEAWSRACSSFQRCSCSKEGTWCQHPEDFLFKTETVLSSLLLWICSLFLGNNYCLIFHFLHTMFCVSWSLELRERLLHQMQSFFCFNPVYRLSIALW